MKVSKSVDQGPVALGGRVQKLDIKLEVDLAIVLIGANANVTRQKLAIVERPIEGRCPQSFLATAGPPKARHDPGESR